MPHQFLLHSDGRADPVNPHPVGMPECVRSHVSQPCRFARPPKFPPDARVDGEQPFAGLTLRTDGNYYGTTAGGGRLGCN
jgi:hypothetical protein